MSFFSDYTAYGSPRLHLAPCGLTGLLQALGSLERGRVAPKVTCLDHPDWRRRARALEAPRGSGGSAPPL
eukprot:8817005-Alexandrium_andersonii.AAC.1